LNKSHHGRHRRRVLTQAGEVQIGRVYFQCVRCRQGGFVVDERLGIAGRYSPQAQRLICLAGGSWSYDLAAQRLAEFCGLSVSDTTIRELAQTHGAQANQWLREEPAAAQEFRQARGDVEFTTDGTSVNTTDGWREMKLGMFSKRERGEPATPAEWDQRTLPTPEVRIAFAAIEESEEFGRRWKAWRKRLGLPDTSAITVLADGAKWIWEEQRKHLRDAEGVLDVYHALQHIAATSQALYPDAPAADAWLDAARQTLLQQAWSGLEAFLKAECASRSAAEQAELNALRNYLAPHQLHLDYAGRLREGRSIGSGQVEGACKNLIGRRLKANAARWRVRRVNRMAGLCCLLYSHQWDTYWNAT
jgi:hypothetical protein